MLTVVGGVSGREPIAVSDVAATLQQPQELQHNTLFTGRPATQLFVASRFVAKLRTDFVFQSQDAEKRALSALALDRRLNAYHPEKTWFVWHTDDQIFIGNIAPRIHTFHSTLPELLQRKPAQALTLLAQLCRLYFSVAHESGFRLDEGLSNFGWTDAGAVYYLDDDRYQWDLFTSFASILAVWIRQLAEFSTEHADIFGQSLCGILLDVFQSPHKIQVLLGQLRYCIAVGGREQQCLNTISACLTKAAYPQRPDRHRSLAVGSTQLSAAETSGDCNANVTSPLAILADIHANLFALQAVLADLRVRQISRILVLGDIVGYGPHPRECIEVLKQQNAIIIQGNHDYAAASGDVSTGFSKLACWAIDWTRRVLTQDDMRWLAELPPYFQSDSWLAVHGAPIDKNYFYGYVYHMTYEANLDWLVQHQIALAFHGHSHVAGVYRRDAAGDSRCDHALQRLSSARCALACPGSVGQPRSGKTAAEYGIFRPADATFELLSVGYDYQRTMDVMRAANFPPALYERLAQGR